MVFGENAILTKNSYTKPVLGTFQFTLNLSIDSVNSEHLMMVYSTNTYVL